MVRSWLRSVSLISWVSSVAAAEAPKPTPEMLEQGKKSFNTVCAACHGEKGDGSGPAAAALTPRPRNFLTEPFKFGEKPEELFKSISEGSPGTAMVPYKHLSEADRWAQAYHVLELRKPGSVMAAAAAKEKADAKPKAGAKGKPAGKAKAPAK